AIAPAAVDDEAIKWRARDDRRAVHAHVHDPAPLPEHLEPRDARHQRHGRRRHLLRYRQRAALAVAVVAVDRATEHETALVRLADVEVSGTVGDDHIEHPLEGFPDG